MPERYALASASVTDVRRRILTPIVSIRFQFPRGRRIIGASGEPYSERLLRLVERAPVESLGVEIKAGRGDWIRTSGPLHPMQVRYQAAPLPDSPVE